MKKSLIFLGVLAGLSTVAQAENKTVLSGSLGYSVSASGTIDRSDNAPNNFKGALDSFGDSIGDNKWDLNTATAKFGISGQEDINDGLQAFYKFDFGVDNQAGVNQTKKAYLGLQGSFGKVTLGNQGSAYKDTINYNDTFNELTPGGEWSSNNSLNNAYPTAGSFRKGIKYETPSMGGFTMAGAVNIDGNDDARKGVDLWEVAAKYDANGITAGAGYQNKFHKGKASDKVMGLSGGYKNDTFQVGAGYSHVASFGNNYNLGAEFYQGNNTYRVGAAYQDPKGKSNNKLDTAVGYQYNFSPRTYTWVEGLYQVREGYKVDGYQVNVGIRHDF